jgi:dTDP-4-amino-4,6-dideoxygalactose transaminase
MFDMQAALGMHQVKRLDIFLKIRENLWKVYDDYFENHSDLLIKPVVKTLVKHSRHLYHIRLKIENYKI